MEKLLQNDKLQKSVKSTYSSNLPPAEKKSLKKLAIFFELTDTTIVAFSAISNLWQLLSIVTLTVCQNTEKEFNVNTYMPEVRLNFTP